MAACRRVGNSPLLIPLIAAMLLIAAPKQASAQFGWGAGMFMGGRVVPSPVDQVNQMSQIAASAAFASRPTNHSPYSGNPNAYMNIGRQMRFSQPELLEPRFSAASRRPMSDQYASGRTRTNTLALASNTTAANPGTTTPAPPLDLVAQVSRFFNAQDEIVWPSDSPTEGDLGERRELSDKASRTVLNEVRSRGTAEISTAADARAKLIDYGRPALQLLRTESSAAIADSFHSFLLSLYETIGKTATNTPAPTER